MSSLDPPKQTVCSVERGVIDRLSRTQLVSLLGNWAVRFAKSPGNSFTVISLWRIVGHSELQAHTDEKGWEALSKADWPSSLNSTNPNSAWDHPWGPLTDKANGNSRAHVTHPWAIPRERIGISTALSRLDGTCRLYLICSVCSLLYTVMKTTVCLFNHSVVECGLISHCSKTDERCNV